MRKVLLATTALVAMSVSAAQAADISISGNLEFEFTQTDVLTKRPQTAMLSSTPLRLLTQASHTA